MSELILIALSASLINNFVLTRFLGICPFMGVSKKVETAAGMGIAVTFVMTLSGTACYMVNEYILKAFDIQYLYTPVFVLLVASLVSGIEMFIKKTSPTLYKALGVYLPLMATNCAIMGVCIINMDSGYGFMQSVVNSFAAAIGFTIAIVLFAGIREHTEHNDIPEHFKGFPVALLGAGLMSIAFSGFAGLIN